MPISKVAEENAVLRLDPLYFRRQDIDRLEQLYAQAHDRLGDICYITDGIHASIDFDKGSGIKVISAKHPKEGCFDLTSVEEISEMSHAVNPRTALKPDDVLISTVGTIGNAAVVRKEMLPANSDRHVGIIRPRRDVERPISSDYVTAFLLSRYGRIQSSRETTGNVQPNLFLIKIRDFKVARFSDHFEAQVKALSLRALAESRSSTDKQKEAEDTLLEALGLVDWTPPEPPSYTARASDALAAGRLDAEHFHPKFAAAFEYMHASDIETRPLERLIEPIRSGVDLREFVDNGTAYIRVGDIKGGRIELEDAKRVPATKETVKQSIYLQEGDVLFTRKGSIGNAAVVGQNDQHAIISTEIMLLRLHKRIRRQIIPDYLAAFFNSSMGKLQAERWAHGVAFYSVTQNDLYKFEIPLVDSGVQEQIAYILGNANRLRDESRRILEAAKRAVEIAIENGEAAAMTFLDQAGEGS